MKINPLIFLLIISISAIQFAGCSGGSDTASGTGVGNPGKTTVSLYADTTNSRADRILRIKTEDSLPLSIDDARFVAKEIRFLLNDEYSADTLDLASNLISLDTAIAYRGTIIFDAITSTSSPSISDIELPEAKYVGLDLILEDDSTKVPEEFKGYVININGTFDYKDTVRDYDMWLNVHEENRDLYKIKGEPIFISKSNHSKFEIVLYANMWLENIYLKQHIEEGQIALNSDGSMTIDSRIDKDEHTHIYEQFNRVVKQNIFKSGEIKITVD